MGRPGAAKKGEVRNPKGRTPGTKNKATLEREELAKRALESASFRKSIGEKLAREVLAEAMMRLWSLSEQAWKDGDIKLSLEYTNTAVAYADKLAPYESPRLQSIAVHRADPFEAMSDDQLWSEYRKRAAAIGFATPERMPVLLNGTAQVLDQQPIDQVANESEQS